MKKILVLMSALLLLAAMCCQAGAETPAVGEQLCGFTVREVERFELIGADVTVYEHDKTGALVMTIINEDLNRSFDMTFHTPTTDDTGLPHVFEHSTLKGSSKYPSGSLFFNLSYQTYNTYMNATTYNVMTTYPIASLSEDQLLKYADFYTDSCLNPMLMQDDSIFSKEAWRYEMADADSPLTLNGTVYSEMQGSYTLSTAAFMNNAITAFPGANVAYLSGGKPSDIPSLTWEATKEYHDSYYHPSNSLTCLYGKLENPGAFLELLDSYFSGYERKEFEGYDHGYTPITGYVQARYEYPVAAGMDTQNGSKAYYTFVCPDATAEDYLTADLYTTLMSADFSPLKRIMREQLPAATANCVYDPFSPELSISFSASGLNDGEEVIFKAIVDEAIAEAARNGFDAEGTDGVIASNKLRNLLIGEDSSLGVNLSMNIAIFWACMDDYNYYFKCNEQSDQLESIVRSGALTEIAERYLIGNELTALSITVPVAGLKDTEDAALAEALAAKKAAMTEDEIAQIVAATNTAKEADDTSEMVRQLTAVTVESLPEECRIFDVTDETDDAGIRSIHIRANVDGVGTTVTMLNANGLEQDQLLYFKLFCDLLCDLPTSVHTSEQLSSLAIRYLYNGVIRVSATKTADGSLLPSMRITFTALDEDLQAGYDLVYELLFDTQFTDAAMIRDRAAAIRTKLKQTINNSPHSIIKAYAEAVTSEPTRYYTHLAYLDYYQFLTELDEKLNTDPEAVMNELKAVQQYFHNASKAITAYIGNETSYAANDAAVASFLGRLDHREIEVKQYELPVIQDFEALMLDLNLQFNCVYASWDQLGSTYEGGLEAISGYVSDHYLYPILRDQNGAYAVLHAFDTNGVYIISYRDPHIAETYDLYAKLGDIIAQDEAPDQETLNGYILSSYSSFVHSGGELSGGLSALFALLEGKDQTDKLTYMNELKAVTPESLTAAAALYRKIDEAGTHITAGSVSALTENADRFTRIDNPFAAVDASQVELSDVAETDWYYTAVRFCYENNLVAASSATEFGAAEPLTLGEIATAMYIGIGGTYDPEAAVAYLAQYDVLPAADVSTPVTREQLAVYAYSFCEAMGVPVAQTEPEGYPDADQFTTGAGAFGCMLGYEIVLPLADGTLAPQAAATRADLCQAMFVIFEE